MPPTVTKIASHAKVSTSLVSRFVNRDPDLRISEEKRRAILRSAKQLGGLPTGRGVKRLKRQLTYRVLVPLNESFSTMDLSHSKSLGVTFQMQFALLKTLKAEGVRLEMTFFDEHRKQEDFLTLVDAPAKCDALVLHRGAANEEVAQLLISRRFPHISVDPRNERLGLNTLLVSETDALNEAMSHLRKLGHEKIAYVGPKNYYRYALIIRAIAEAHFELREEWHCFMPDSRDDPSWQNDHGQSITDAAFDQWLATHKDVSAVICSSDHVMLGAIDAMHRRGLTPGREISLVGYNNMEQRGFNLTTQPMLTTIDHPSERIGERCAALLLAQIQRKQTDTVHERVPTQLIPRSTTGPRFAH